jgi:hypothetical protein
VKDHLPDESVQSVSGGGGVVGRTLRRRRLMIEPFIGSNRWRLRPGSHGGSLGGPAPRKADVPAGPAQFAGCVRRAGLLALLGAGRASLSTILCSLRGGPDLRHSGRGEDLAHGSSEPSICMSCVSGIRRNFGATRRLTTRAHQQPKWESEQPHPCRDHISRPRSLGAVGSQVGIAPEPVWPKSPPDGVGRDGRVTGFGGCGCR